MFRTHGIPFYLKIDIEGADHLVLDELGDFEDRPRYISMEAEKVDFSQLVSELNLLKRLGYRTFKPVQTSVDPGHPNCDDDSSGRTASPCLRRRRFWTIWGGPFRPLVELWRMPSAIPQRSLLSTVYLAMMGLCTTFQAECA